MRGGGIHTTQTREIPLRDSSPDVGRFYARRHGSQATQNYIPTVWPKAHCWTTEDWLALWAGPLIQGGWKVTSLHHHLTFLLQQMCSSNLWQWLLETELFWLSYEHFKNSPAGGGGSPLVSKKDPYCVIDTSLWKSRWTRKINRQNNFFTGYPYKNDG